MLAAAAVVVVASFPPANASGGCYRTQPETPGSVTMCVVGGAGRYAVATATQWELRVYRASSCTGEPGDIDSTLTRTGRTPSAGAIDFGTEPRCVALRLTDTGIMAVDAELPA